MNLYEAILVRKSVKNYYMDELEQSMLKNIMNFANHLSMLFEEQKVQYKMLNYANTDKKLLGVFSVKAPYYFLIASDSINTSQINQGYLMQQVSLYLTTKGLGSCLLGIKKIKNIDGMAYESALVLAFGKSKESIYCDSRKGKHIEEKEFCIYKCEPDSNLKLLMKVVSLSPSSLTIQPWRFVLYDNRIHIFCKRDMFHAKLHQETKNIEMGTVLAHLLVTAEELWLQSSVKKLDNITNKDFRNNDYMLSVLLKI